MCFEEKIPGKNRGCLYIFLTRILVCFWVKTELCLTDFRECFEGWGYKKQRLRREITESLERGGDRSGPVEKGKGKVYPEIPVTGEYTETGMGNQGVWKYRERNWTGDGIYFLLSGNWSLREMRECSKICLQSLGGYFLFLPHGI